VMQRLHSDDLVGHLLREGGWTHLNLPAIAEVEEQIQLGPNRFHVRKVGDLLHSERESQAVLDQIKRSMGLSEFTAQFQQAPVPPGGNMVKWACLDRHMSSANPLWGAPRIHGELLKLGIKVSQATVGRWMPWRSKVPSPTWRSFLRNHLPCGD
jgi:hypothetical protein